MADLLQEATSRGITPPIKRTLSQYGMVEDDWLQLMAEQNWKCPICDKTKATWNIDHEHIPGWKKMAPQMRRRFVRGILCFYCNKYLVQSRVRTEVAQKITDYLGAYDARRLMDED